jgi:predicted glycoside hydrolase/deacetylase ChbG (UPF0249 family)
VNAAATELKSSGDNMKTRIQLVTRGDDAGSCESANSAIVQACDSGTLRNVSVMAPGPHFASAAQLFAGRSDVCFGLHITLNSEWDKVKWGPVLPAHEVPSLVDANGHFWPSPMVLHERGFNSDEAMAEIEAQLRHVRTAGLHLSYIDEHMGVSWIGGLRERIRVLAQSEGLIDVHSMSGLPAASSADGSLLQRWETQLQNAQPGTYVLVTHPGRDEEDMGEMYMQGVQPGAVARERDAERQALCDPQFQQICRENDVRFGAL